MTDERTKLALFVLQQLERALLKFRANSAASPGPEFVAIEAALREAGHKDTATPADVREDLQGAIDFDRLITDIDAMLYDYAAGDDQEIAVGDLIVDCLRTGDINTLIRSDYHLNYIADAVGEEWMTSGMFSFLTVLVWLGHYKDRLEEGPLEILGDGEEEEFEDDTEYADDDDDLFVDGFDIDDPQFPSEEA